MSASTIDVRDAVVASALALKRAASYSLPKVLDRRILELGERKESLTAEERAELEEWVEFTQQRSIDRLDAQSALRRLASAFPDAQVAS